MASVVTDSGLKTIIVCLDVNLEPSTGFFEECLTIIAWVSNMGLSKRHMGGQAEMAEQHVGVRGRMAEEGAVGKPQLQKTVTTGDLQVPWQEMIGIECGREAAQSSVCFFIQH